MPDVKNGMFGWQWTGLKWLPIPSTNTSAPTAIMELIKCNCHGACGTQVCTCFRGKMTCTEMCHVTGENSCENTDTHDVAGIQSDDEEFDEYP